MNVKHMVCIGMLLGLVLTGASTTTQAAAELATKSNDPMVTRQTPPTFLFHVNDVQNNAGSNSQIAAALPAPEPNVSTASNNRTSAVQFDLAYLTKIALLIIIVVMALTAFRKFRSTYTDE